MSETTKLTKKQQKAIKHRSRSDKGKGKADEEQAAFPEEEVLDDEGTASRSTDIAAAKEKKEKKSKKKSAVVDDGLPYAPIEPDSATLKPKDKAAGKKRKREDAATGGEATTNAENGTAADSKPKAAKKPKTAESKQRYIVFVGNLPYKVETEDIIKHFEETCGEKPSVRLMTPRNAGQSKNPAIAVKSKGCAFVEFKTSAAVQSALHLHQSTFVSSMSSAKRKINVELTAGGGGNSDTRKQKLSALKERLEKQREKHKTEADIAKEKKEEEQKAVRAEWAKNEAANAKAAKKTKKPPRFISGANSTKLG